MKIETERLMLRNYKMSDMDDYVHLMQQEKVANHAGFFVKDDNYRLTIQLKDEVENPLKFAIILKDSNQFVGEIGLNSMGMHTRKLYGLHDDEYSREVEFCLSEEFWGKQIMSESLSALIKISFEHLGLDSIVGASYSKNLASKKVQLKCGLIPYKTDKNYVWRETGETCKVFLSKIMKEQYKHIGWYKDLKINIIDEDDYSKEK